MVLKSDLQVIIKTQIDSIPASEEFIPRDIINEIDPFIPFAIILTGIRRCGKSTLLYQLLKKYNNLNYLNFEDPRLINFDIADFEKVETIFNSNENEVDIYFFDEIQSVEKWELYVRSLIDRKKHIIITGSNSSLLSREFGSRLTGRHLKYELFPFSYKEFLKFTKKSPDQESFKDFMEMGGFPEYIKIGRIQILQQLLNDILSRDISVRNNIRNIKQLNELIIYILSNIGKPFSLNGLQKTFQFGSVNTVKDFISYFEDSYLIFTIPRFSYSLKKQSTNPKKVYAIDTGMIKSNTTGFSEDNGRILENIVFLELRRKFNSIYYLKEKNECDFVIYDRDKIVQAIQVCFELNTGNLQRKINGCKEAMDMFGLDESLILTFGQEDIIMENGYKINVEPIWKWLTY